MFRIFVVFNVKWFFVSCFSNTYVSLVHIKTELVPNCKTSNFYSWKRYLRKNDQIANKKNHLSKEIFAKLDFYISVHIITYD